MRRQRTKRRLIGRGLTAAMAVAGIAAASAAPAGAAAAQGSVAVILASHAKGRTLSGQGVTIQAGSPATKDGQTLSLPILDVDPGSGASATADGWLRFKRGKKGVVVSALRFDFATGTLKGRLGDEEISIFGLGAAASLNASTGAVSLQDAKLRLTADAAGTLKEKLGLERALRRDGVGMAWLSAKAKPALEAAKPVASGNAAWGMLASWRAYVLGQQGPPMSIGSISVEEGATTNGTMSEANAFFGLPAASGSFEKGLYGASDRLTLQTAGAMIFKKPFHCINELKLSDVELRIDGSNSAIVLDMDYDIDKPEGMTCGPLPAVSSPDVTFATLDVSGVTPAYSADGKTVTWTAVPAALTAAGTAPFGKTYKAGQPLDPITVTVTTG
jgi:Htaa